MKVIYMQETIDAMFKKDPSAIQKLEKIGTPEIVELLDKDGKTKTKYYKYENQPIELSN